MAIASAYVSARLTEAVRSASLAVGRPIVRADSADFHFPDETLLLSLSFTGLPVKGVRLVRSTAEPDQVLAPTSGSVVYVTGGLRLIDIARVLVESDSEQAVSASVTLDLAYLTSRFASPAIPIEWPAQKGEREILTLRSDRQDRRKELIAHLNANRTYYSNLIHRALDSGTVVAMLAGYTWNGRPLIDQVEPQPLTMAGNYLVFRAPVDPGEPSGVKGGGKPKPWAELLADRAITVGRQSADERLIPLPTAGVFAEAVLGRSNAAEKLDITRFWQWQDSPIPLTPTEIAPVGTGSRATAEDLKPGALGQPVLNIVNPAGLPAPAGLGAVLGAISTPNMFKDMSGLAGTQGLVQAGMEQTLHAATDAGQIASANLRTEAQKAVSMAQVAADIVRSVMGGGGGGSSVQGISGVGATINHGRSLDQRQAGGGAGATSGGAGGAGSGGASPGNATGSPAGGSGSQATSNEQAAYQRGVWGPLGEPGAAAARSIPVGASAPDGGPQLQQVGDTYARPAGANPNHIVGQMGELLTEEALKKQNHLVFRDWRKAVQGNGVDLFSLAPAEPPLSPARELWVFDNKAQLRGISGADALTGPQAIGNLKEIEDFLKNVWPNRQEAELALKALKENRVKLVVSNAFAGETTRFTKAVFAKGLHVYDIRLGKLYASHAAWEEAFKKIASSLRKGVRLTGLRGAAMLEGTFLVMAVAGGAKYLFQNGADARAVIGEVAATFALDALLARLPAGWAASLVIGLESDETEEQRELRKLRERLVPDYLNLPADVQRATDAALLELIRNPLKVEVPPEPAQRPTLPGFDMNRWGAPRTDWA